MATPAIITLPFRYTFNTPGRLEETGNIDNSSSPYWWVSSGAYMDLKDGVGQTAHGELAAGSKWQVAFEKANPTDTDGGVHPQNIFRMTSRAKFQDVAHGAWFRI